MYGVDAELMRRMQRRIKEKIYREMIEEEDKMKRKAREEKAKSREFQFRNHTQPNEKNIRKSMPNRYEDDSPSSLIDQESSFLPVINSRQRPSIEDDESPNPSYKDYVQKREERTRPQRSKSRYNKRSSTSAALPTDYDEEGQESEDEKAEKYLSQCQQIISNLREITKKNNKRATQRENKYEPPSPQFASKNKSFNGTLTPKEPIRQSLTYSSKRNQPISLRIMRPNQPKNEDIGYEYQGMNNPRKSRGMKRTREEEQTNQFYQFQQSPSRFPPKVNTRKLSSLQTTQNEAENSPSKSGSKNLQGIGESKPQKKQKARQNFKRLSPIKTKAQEAEDNQSKGEDQAQQQKPNQQEEEQEMPKDKKDTKDSRKKQPKRSSKTKKGGDEDQAIDEQQNDDETSPKPSNDSKKEKEKLQKQKARQKAIVKYLKKARMRGNLLYQKMESQKPGQQQSSQPNLAQPEVLNTSAFPKDSK